MKSSFLRNLLMAVACILTGVTAQAQLTGTYEEPLAKDFGITSVKFTLTEVATALNTDAATLAAALDAWTANGSGENMFFLKVGDELSVNYTQGSKGGFWVNAEGAPQAWSDDNSGLRWYNTISWDADGDLFAINIGQYPDQCSVDDVFTPQFILKYGDNEVTFDLTIKFKPRPVFEIPEPTLQWKDLNVVQEITVDVNQKPRYDYNADYVVVDLKEAIEKLGITDLSLVRSELDNLLYITNYYTGEDIEMAGLKDNLLTKETSANGLGFWVCALQEQEGDAFECARYIYQGSYFFMEMFDFDAQTGQLSCNLGQMPGKLVGGRQYYAFLYIIFGEKAICIRYNLNVIAVELGTLDNLEMAGEESIDLTMEPMNDYATKNFNVDINAIASALGCEVADIEFRALKDDVTFTTSNADNGGYWFGQYGYVIDHGDNTKAFVMPVVSGNLSKLGIGQHPGHMTVGDEVTVSVYFVGNGKYFKYTVNLTIVPSTLFEGDFVSVAQRTIDVQQVPVVYIWTPGIDIPAEWVEEQIGTSDWVVYGLAPLNEDGSEKEGNERYTKSYSCTPYPGFWLSADGHNNGWNSNARIGITAAAPDLSEGGFAMIQYEGDVCKIGDVFRTQIFLVNETNGKMVTFNFIYSIVESVQEIETVGKENLVIPVTMEGERSAIIDLAKAAAALGTTVDDLSDGHYLYGMTEAGIYGSGNDFLSGLTFDQKGYCVTDEGFMFFDIEPNDDGTTGTLTMYSNEAVSNYFNVSGQFCLLVGDKRYVYYVKFVSDAISTGIETVDGSRLAVDNTVYDLQGRRVKNVNHEPLNNHSTLKQGIYLRNGRKYLVK